MSKVLLVVDMQGDFLDGSLPVPDTRFLASEIALISPDYDLVIATRDLHPSNHCSFKAFGGIFPSHCVKGSVGVKLHRHIDAIADIIISKGTHSDKEAFSGFDGTVLDEILMSLQNPGEPATEVDVVGVATEYCVRATVFDANAMGFKVRVLENLIRGIDPIDAGETLQEFIEAGIKIV